jgi:hypothetical protein
MFVNNQKRCNFAPGEMAEWSIAAVLKTVDPQGSGGSNPSLSAGSESTKTKTTEMTDISVVFCFQEVQTKALYTSESSPQLNRNWFWGNRNTALNNMSQIGALKLKPAL